MSEPFTAQRPRARWSALWQPPSAEARLVAAIGALALLGLSASALALSPLFMPAVYSVSSQTLSEAAAQALPNGWVARLGFLTFGQAVLWLAAAFQDRWARIAWWPHALFGVFMMGAAAFSQRPWIEGAPADEFEDALHALMATAMGFAFALGTAARYLQRRIEREPGGTFDFVALAASVALPLAMITMPAYAGFAQRAMFAVAYLWYGLEALRVLRAHLRSTNGPPESGRAWSP
jgi:hypothetical protein